jgi:hypothetical protein
LLKDQGRTSNAGRIIATLAYPGVEMG